MNVKVEFAPLQLYTFLDSEAGDTWNGHPILFSVPDSQQAIIQLPDDWTMEQVVLYMDAAVANGEVIDWRMERNDYSVLGEEVIPRLNETLVVGDTFVLHGIDADIRKRGKDGAGVMIAICDTGVDSRHAMFAGIAVTGEGKDRDSHDHGTHCASTAGGTLGVAPKSPIYAGWALPQPGGFGTEADIANAIRHSVDAGAKVVSLSLGGGPSQVMDSACEYAKARGAIVVVAAGNGGGRPIGSPARAADLIVMAHDRSDQWASFTDGRNWSNPQRVGANGVSIEAAKRNSGTGTMFMSGTSMACPHVAGFAALLLAAGMSRNSAIEYLLSHKKNPPDGPGKVLMKPDFGAVEPAPPPVPPPTPTPPPVDPDLKSELNERRAYMALTYNIMNNTRVKYATTGQHVVFLNAATGEQLGTMKLLEIPDWAKLLGE